MLDDGGPFKILPIFAHHGFFHDLVSDGTEIVSRNRNSLCCHGGWLLAVQAVVLTNGREELDEVVSNTVGNASREVVLLCCWLHRRLWNLCVRES